MQVDYTTRILSIPSQDGAFYSVKMPIDLTEDFANINLHFTDTARTLNGGQLHYTMHCTPKRTRK